MLEGCDAVTYQNWVGKANGNSKPLQITNNRPFAVITLLDRLIVENVQMFRLCFIVN